MQLVESRWRSPNLVNVLISWKIFGRSRSSVSAVQRLLFMLAICTVVFSEISRTRWSDGSNSKAATALTLFPGLMPVCLFAEGLTPSYRWLHQRCDESGMSVRNIANCGAWSDAFRPPHQSPSLADGVYALVQDSARLRVIYLGCSRIAYRFILGLSWMLTLLRVYPPRDRPLFIGMSTTVRFIPHAVGGRAVIYPMKTAAKRTLVTVKPAPEITA